MVADPRRGATLAHHVPARLVLAVVMAAADREVVFGPNDLRAGLEAAGGSAVLHAAGLGPGVPNIGHRAGEQRPGLAPISPVVIDYFADRPRPDRLDDRAGRNPPGRPIARSAGLIAPSRVVINAVGRVGDHKVRRDATEHALDIRRDRAVAAEETGAAEHP